MPVSASSRIGSALSYVEELEYRKEIARLLAKKHALSISIYSLLENSPAEVEKLLTKIREEMEERGLLADMVTAAYEHEAILGITRADVLASLEEDLDDIVRSNSARVLGEANTMLLSRAGEVSRTIARMAEEGVSAENIAKALSGQGKEAILGPLISGATQTAVGLISGIDIGVAREAAQLDTLSQLAADGGMPMFAWETRGDEKVCDDLFEDSCAQRHGAELPMDEWEAMGVPGAENLICSIYAKGAFSNCRCKLVRPDMVEKLPEPLKVEEAAARGKERAQAEMGLKEEKPPVKPPEKPPAQGAISRVRPSAAISEAETGGAALTSANVQPSGASTQEPVSKFQISSRPSPDAGITARRIEPSTLEGGTSSREFIDPSRPILQPPGTAEDFRRMGQEAFPDFKATLDRAVAEIPGVSYVEHDPAGVARVKKPPTPGSRLEAKLKTRGAQQIDDYLAGRLQFNSPEAFRQLTDYLDNVYGKALKADDFLATGKPFIVNGPEGPVTLTNGYRAVHVTYRLPNGLAAEIQIIPEQMAAIKDYWHENVYEVYRLPWRPKTRAEWQEAISAIDTQNASFEDAYQHFLKGEPLPTKPSLTAAEVHAIERPWEVTPAEFKAAALHAREGFWRGGYYRPFQQTEAGISEARIAVKWGDQVFIANKPMSHGDLAVMNRVPLDEAIPGAIVDGRFIYTSPKEAYAMELRWALNSDFKIPDDVLEFFDLNPDALAEFPGSLQDALRDRFAMRMFEQGQPAIRLNSGEVIVGDFADSHWKIAADHGLSIDDIKDTGFIGPIDSTGAPSASARYRPAALEEGNITINRLLPADEVGGALAGSKPSIEHVKADAAGMARGRAVLEGILDPKSGETIESALAKAEVSTVGSSVDALNAKLKGAGYATQDGEFAVWHVTSDPDRLIKVLNTGGDLMTTFGREAGDLGPGLYGSGEPQLWTGRATEKWSFLKGMPVEQRKSLSGAILDDLAARGAGYVTASEMEYVHRILNAFVDSGFPDALVSLADQPFNVAFWKPDFLKGLGITPGAQPSVVKIRLRGKFINLADAPNRNIWSDDSRVLRAAGYDGAFTPMGWADTPQLVIWNRSAILGYEIDEDLAWRLARR